MVRGCATQATCKTSSQHFPTEHMKKAQWKAPLEEQGGCQRGRQQVPSRYRGCCGNKVALSSLCCLPFPQSSQHCLPVCSWESWYPSLHANFHARANPILCSNYLGSQRSRDHALQASMSHREWAALSWLWVRASQKGSRASLWARERKTKKVVIQVSAFRNTCLVHKLWKWWAKIVEHWKQHPVLQEKASLRESESVFSCGQHLCNSRLMGNPSIGFHAPAPKIQLWGCLEWACRILPGPHTQHQSNAAAFITAVYENYHKSGMPLPAELLPKEGLLI